MSILRRDTQPEIPCVDVITAHDRPGGVILVDVREPSEWAEGHAPAAHLRPLGELDLDRLPTADTYYVICRSGNRSAHATRALVEAGIDAHNVTGGMNAWIAAGLPSEHD
jgi:rhodanese-related sulfurtransferase